MKIALRLLFAMTFVFILTAISFPQVAINTDQSPPESSAMLDVKSSGKGFLPPRMTTGQMNAISGPSNGLIVYNTTTQALYWYSGTAWKQIGETSPVGNIHAIGENYGGGIVFYIYDGGLHGLIAATADQGSGIQWHNGTNRISGSTGDGINAGDMNTGLITSAQLPDNQNGVFAAKICADYSFTLGNVTYGDWYLPSKLELNLLFLQRAIVGGFSNTDYWSSTEINENEAWSQYFYDGFQSGYEKDGALLIRPIRAF